MNVTGVRITLAASSPAPGSGRCLAYASLVLDEAYAVKDLRLILGPHGPFLAMPARAAYDRCQDRSAGCYAKVPRDARFCPACGVRLGPPPAFAPEDARGKRFHDLFHPLTVAARAALESAVIAAYEAELARPSVPAPAPAVA